MTRDGRRGTKVNQDSTLDTRHSTRLRFPKSARLTRSAEFRRVRQEGETFHGRFMVLGILRDVGPASGARIGFITSRRVGNAVVRNRVRRRLREIVRLDRSRLHSAWVVIVAKGAGSTASFEQIRGEWIALGTRAAIFK